MPTSKEHIKVLVNGVEVKLGAKKKLPAKVDWQKRVLEVREATIEIDVSDLEEA